MRRALSFAITALAIGSLSFVASAIGCLIVDHEIARVSPEPGPIPVDASIDSGLVCPQKPGTSWMVPVGSFCIDATEVTKAQYKRFVDADPKLVQRAECDWNLPPKAFGPHENAGELCTGDVVDLTKDPDHPVVCVDWCDAAAYCQWVGKRLCGAIAGGPEPYSSDDVSFANDREKSQWFAACVGDPPRKYPYGDVYLPGACNDVRRADGGLDAARAVGAGSMAACHGPGGTPFAAVFDLSGNVYEWVDRCQSTPGDRSRNSCTTRGGFFKNEDGPATSWLACALVPPTINTKERRHFDDHIGFRCCAP